VGFWCREETVDHAERADDAAVVPALVERTVSDARKAAVEAGVAVRAADPDGPPLPASTWPAVWYVTAQRPAAGRRVRRWSTVAVWFEERRGGGGGDREPRRPRPDPGVPTATGDASVNTG
jgi:hypothetical protein